MGASSVVRILLEAGADCMLEDRVGTNALILAHQLGYDHIVALLRTVRETRCAEWETEDNPGALNRDNPGTLSSGVGGSAAAVFIGTAITNEDGGDRRQDQGASDTTYISSNTIPAAAPDQPQGTAGEQK